MTRFKFKRKERNPIAEDNQLTKALRLKRIYPEMVVEPLTFKRRNIKREAV